MQNCDFLDLEMLSGGPIKGPLVLPWPSNHKPSDFLIFSTPAEWKHFLCNISLPLGTPEVVSVKFRRAQMLYFMSWLYFDLVKAGELVALTALELALTDRYGETQGDKKKRKTFSGLLHCLIEDGLTDEKLPIVRRFGGTVVGIVTGDRQPSLSRIRNSFAHGDPLDGLPYAGLLELVRDLIGYAYRDMT